MLVHIDLVDKDGQMNIIVNITNKLIPHFVDHFFHGTTIQITNFAIKKEYFIEERKNIALCRIIL